MSKAMKTPMRTPRAAVILAAGKSTRMKSARSKVLHHVGGRSMLEWVTELARSTGAEKIVCVVGEANADVRAAAEALGLDIAVQEPQLGTAHAVSAAKKALRGFKGNLAILYADTPFVTKRTLNRVYKSLETGADVTVLGFEPDDPGAYGRLITHKGELTAIVEAREASPEELAVGLCNSGVVAASVKNMFWALDRVDNNNRKGEYYLTDIVQILRSNKKKAKAIIADTDEVMGVNSRLDLAIAEMSFQVGMRQAMLKKGVTLRDPDTIYFSHDTKIAPDAEIGANVVFGPGVKIAKHAIIHPFCHIEGTKVGEGAQIGPFARLRPGTDMGAGSKVGNFVETKKAKIGKGSKINHLSYIGDAKVGVGANVGAGAITCNYDGYFKHQTHIGDGAFVGTNSSLVAPVKVGKGAYLGSGGVITKDVPAGALAVARADQVNKAGWAKRYNAAQKKRKAKKT